MQIPDASLGPVFRTARTDRAWRDQPLADGALRALYELMKWGPTSGNWCPS